jgi:iron only hydrogenase large subunit-like protein
MIKSAGLDFVSLPDGTMDNPLGVSSGAADIFANTGGVMEAAARTAYEIISGRPLPVDNLHIQAVAGLDGIKEATLPLENLLPDWKFLEGQTLKVAVAHGLGNAAKLLDAIAAGKASYHFVEIMTCPGGCIGAAGSPASPMMRSGWPASTPSTKRTKARPCANHTRKPGHQEDL